MSKTIITDLMLFLLYTGMIVYAAYKFYNWAQSLNPYDFSDKR